MNLPRTWVLVVKHNAQAPGNRAVAALLLAIFLSMLLAGCVAKGGDDETVLKAFERGSSSDSRESFVFKVGKDTDQFRVYAQTRPEKEVDDQWCDWEIDYTTGQMRCDDQDGAPPGRMRVTIRDPDGATVVTMTLPFDSQDEQTVPDPVPGTYQATITYQNSYDGPAVFRVTAPSAQSGTVIGGGSFWDILGIILAVGVIIGGWVAYRHRTNFLRREMHKIDHAFQLSNEDLDESRQNLLTFRNTIKEMLVGGKIQESQYLILEKRIDQYLIDLDTPGNRHRATTTAASTAPAWAATTQPRRAEHPPSTPTEAPDASYADDVKSVPEHAPEVGDWTPVERPKKPAKVTDDHDGGIDIEFTPDPTGES